MLWGSQPLTTILHHESHLQRQLHLTPGHLDCEAGNFPLRSFPNPHFFRAQTFFVFSKMMGMCLKNIACSDSFSLKRVYCLAKKSMTKSLKKWFSTKPRTALLLFGASHKTCTVLWSSRLSVLLTNSPVSWTTPQGELGHRKKNWRLDWFVQR